MNEIPWTVAFKILDSYLQRCYASHRRHMLKYQLTIPFTKFSDKERIKRKFTHLTNHRIKRLQDMSELHSETFVEEIIQEKV